MQEQKQIDDKNYILTDDLKELAKNVIEKEKTTLHFNDDDTLKIGYMYVYPNITNTVAARCIKSAKELKFFSNYDYIIQFSGELFDTLSEEVKYILMYHELSHIEVNYNKKGKKILKIRDHTVKDFKIILERYGINWLNIIQESTASLYDLDDSNKVTL